jgi:hypothetical protein
MVMLGPLLNWKSDLSVRKAVLLYKQLIHPMMDYACPGWRSAAHTHVRKLQVLLSKCLFLATGAPWYVSNRQIHEHLGVPSFADHIRALIASFDSKLTDVRKLPKLMLPACPAHDHSPGNLCRYVKGRLRSYKRM